MPTWPTTPKHGDDNGNTVDAAQPPGLATSIAATTRSDKARLARRNLYPAGRGLSPRVGHSVRDGPSADLAVQLGFRRHVRLVRAEPRVESRQPRVRFAWQSGCRARHEHLCRALDLHSLLEAAVAPARGL